MPGFLTSSCFSSAVLLNIVGSAFGVLRAGDTQSLPAPLSTTVAGPSLLSLTSLSIPQKPRIGRGLDRREMKCGYSCRSQLATCLGPLVPVGSTCLRQGDQAWLLNTLSSYRMGDSRDRMGAWDGPS